MSEDFKKTLVQLNLFRDWVEHLSLCVSPDGVETYKSNIINKIDSLINTVANPNQESLSTSQVIDKHKEDFTPKQLWFMAQKLNMDDFVQIVEEIKNIN